MKNDILASLTHLSDVDLVTGMKTLLARERGATAELIAHLAELDTRDFHLREGYPSLFVYCRDALGLSEWEAYNRIEVAHAARRFPLILELLAAGAVHLTAVRLLTPHLTPDNHREVLESARGKRKAEVEEIVAKLSPLPDARFSVRRVPRRRAAMATADSVMTPRGEKGDAAINGAGITPSTMPFDSASASPGVGDRDGSVPRAREVQGLSHCLSSEDAAAVTPKAHPSQDLARSVQALSPDRYKLELTISGETLEKLRLCADMLGHTLPKGDAADVVERGLTALLTELTRKKFADAPRPREPEETAGHECGCAGEEAGVPARTGRGEAGGVGARSRALCVRRLERPSLQRETVRGVPPCRPSCPRWRGDGRGHPTAVPAPQRLRRPTVFRPAANASRRAPTCSGTS